MMAIRVSIVSFIGSGVQPMHQVSSTHVSCRGIGGTISGLNMPHSIDGGQLSSMIVTCLLLALHSWVVLQFLMLLMVVFSVHVVYVHLLYGLLSDIVLCGRISVHLRCAIRYARRGGVSSVIATYASFCLSVAVLYSWRGLCLMCSLPTLLALTRLGWMHFCTCVGVPLLGLLVQ